MQNKKEIVTCKGKPKTQAQTLVFKKYEQSGAPGGVIAILKTLSISLAVMCLLLTHFSLKILKMVIRKQSRLRLDAAECSI